MSQSRSSLPVSQTLRCFSAFVSERQILAVLDHPKLVKLLDGGTPEDGLLYLVMEHVEGTPIEEYCRQRQVPIWERLRLFCTICDAVHSTHQQLIVRGARGRFQQLGRNTVEAVCNTY